MTREVKCKDGWRSSMRLIFMVSPHQPEHAARVFPVFVTTTECDCSCAVGCLVYFKLTPVQSAQTLASSPVSLWSCPPTTPSSMRQRRSNHWNQSYLSVCSQSWWVERGGVVCLRTERNCVKITHLHCRETLFLSPFLSQPGLSFDDGNAAAVCVLLFVTHTVRLGMVIRMWVWPAVTTAVAPVADTFPPSYLERTLRLITDSHNDIILALYHHCWAST